MYAWQDFFKLVEVCKYKHGGHTVIGGDPDMHSRDPVVYHIIDLETDKQAEGVGTMAMPKYTAEYFAKKALNIKLNKLERIIIEG